MNGISMLALYIKTIGAKGITYGGLYTCMIGKVKSNETNEQILKVLFDFGYAKEQGEKHTRFISLTVKGLQRLQAIEKII